ncbi:hypothetical protein QF037_000173 [Streptomyces canus]|uniref:hypothetical protein n=1 Tax=Streptomyces canus TaxID=58343 RepID=UPI00278960E7|nr:hypothetical protein [Streptomyces canus]MDQ0595828.1 hypothetical protein [Streptomyces canus]
MAYDVSATAPRKAPVPPLVRAPSAHEGDLRRLAYQLTDGAGLQRGRLTGLVLKGEDLIDADQAPRQLSLDDAREARLAAETAVDLVRDVFGPQVIGPAAVFRRAFNRLPPCRSRRLIRCSGRTPVDKACAGSASVAQSLVGRIDVTEPEPASGLAAHRAISSGSVGAVKVCAIRESRHSIR